VHEAAARRVGAERHLVPERPATPLRRATRRHPTHLGTSAQSRLRELEAKGVITRRVVPTSPPSVEYDLTDLGRELVPALAAIVAVGHKLKTQPGRTLRKR